MLFSLAALMPVSKTAIAAIANIANFFMKLHFT
jgi:hypothetical protein